MIFDLNLLLPTYKVILFIILNLNKKDKNISYKTFQFT